MTSLSMPQPREPGLLDGLSTVLPIAVKIADNEAGTGHGGVPSLSQLLPR